MRNTWYILNLIAFFACNDFSEIKIPGKGGLTVVEGWLTDSLDHQYLYISKTVPFSSPNSMEPVTDARVTLYENNSSIRYHHVKGGQYRTQNPFKGKKNHRYRIEIILEDGTTIRSTEEMMGEVPAIENIAHDFFTEPSEEDPQEEVMVFYPVVYSSDDPEKVNFYRYRFYKNDTLFNRPEDIFLLEDRFIKGQEPCSSDGQQLCFPNEFPEIRLEQFDTIRVELQEISSDAHNYLRQLKLQTTSIGTRSSISPSSIRGNLTSESDPGLTVLGYFGVVSITSTEYVLNP